MAPRTPSRAPLALAAAALLVGAGHASAQSCARDGPSVMRCRFVLSQPRAFTAEASARFARGRLRSPATLALAIDGRSCLGRDAALGWGRRVSASCAVRLQPAEHPIEARVATSGVAPAAIAVRLLPSPRLAALPREAGELYPPRTRRPWFWPFGR